MSYRTNLRLYELLEDRTYLETAYNQIQDKADAMADDLKENFLNYPIPKQIVEDWEKVQS
jgi:predicted component of type VI protein secretion system